MTDTKLKPDAAKAMTKKILRRLNHYRGSKLYHIPKEDLETIIYEALTKGAYKT